MPSSTFILRAGLALVSLTTTLFEASAQSTVTPTGAWKPLSTSCPAGGDPNANGGLGGGGYLDKWGGLWDARCSQALSGFVFEGNQGTGSQGWYGCAKGCAKRPRCTAFHFVANANLAASSWNERAGSGTCYYRVDAGTYSTDTTIYGATHLIRANTQLPCPAYNGQQFVDASGYAWQVYCNTDIDATTPGSAAAVNVVQAPDILGCMRQCNSQPDCEAFRYNYQGPEINEATESATPTAGPATCYLKNSQGATGAAGTTATVHWMSRIARVVVQVTSTTVTTSSTSTANGAQPYVVTTTTTTTPAAPPVVTTTTTTTPAAPQVYAVTTTTTTTPAAPPPAITTTTTTTPAAPPPAITTTTTTTPAAPPPVITTTTTTTPAAPPPATTTMSSSTTSAAAVSTGTCTNTPNPPSLATLACSSANAGSQGNVYDACGVRYEVICGSDTNPDSYGSIAATGIHDCMLKCDASPNCKAAVFAGSGGSGSCYFKSSFASLKAANGATTAALVRYYPPNPNYAAPVAATGGGCGIPLPANLTANGPSTRFNMTPSDGIPRSFLIHIPKFYDVNKASPVIFAFHGNQATAETIESQTRLDDSTTNPYAITIYMQGAGNPSGYESNPNYGASGTTAPNNVQRDVDWVKQLVPQIQNMFCIDSTRIFATGHSNGGGFTGVIACDPSLSATFAAIAANSGAFYSYTLAGGDPNTVDTNTPTQQICSPSKNMPIFEAHGTGDTTINYYGGDRNGRTLPTLPRWMNAWATRQGVSTNNYTTYPSARTTLVQWGNATGELGRISHFRLENWVHEWPNGQGSAPIDYTPFVMDFFYRWTNPNRGLIYAPSSNSLTSAPAATTTTMTTTTSSVTTTTSSQAGSSSSSTGSSSSSSTGTGSLTTSSTGLLKSSSTSTSALASRTAVACVNNALFTDTQGQTYRLYCDADSAAGGGPDANSPSDVEIVAPGDFRECMAACDAKPECGAFGKFPDLTL